MLCSKKDSSRTTMNDESQPRPRMFPNEYLDQISDAIQLSSSVAGSSSLIAKISSLLARIVSEETGSVHPGQLYVELDGLLFELKCISHLIRQQSSEAITYEPPGIDPSGKLIDLTYSTNDGLNGMECKATNPRTNDRPIPYELFANELLITNQLYYSWISSARSHLLEFLVDTEAKLTNYPKFNRSILCIYKNFYIEDFELEHIWHFYKKGVPAPNDTFSKMMLFEVSRKGFAFQGSINGLLAIPFEQYGFGLREDDEIIKLD